MSAEPFVNQLSELVERFDDIELATPKKRAIALTNCPP